MAARERSIAVFLLLGGVLLCGCAAQSGSAPARAAASSILASSNPAAGSTVSAPVEDLILNFSPPARLDEVTINGPDGLTPMKVTPAGEVSHYSLPISATAPGPYTVNWRATSGATAHRGSFSFTIK